MSRDRLYLLDILEAIERIKKYTQDAEEWRQDELVQTWVIHHIQIIGEASRALSPEMKARYPHILWRDIVRMRNILVHQYFDVDVATVQSVVDSQLPILRHDIQGILRAEFGESVPLMSDKDAE